MIFIENVLEAPDCVKFSFILALSSQMCWAVNFCLQIRRLTQIIAIFWCLCAMSWQKETAQLNLCIYFVQTFVSCCKPHLLIICASINFSFDIIFCDTNFM